MVLYRDRGLKLFSSEYDKHRGLSSRGFRGLLQSLVSSGLEKMFLQIGKAEG